LPSRENKKLAPVRAPMLASLLKRCSRLVGSFLSDDMSVASWRLRAVGR
jgi:hypothetical protein